MKYLFTLFITLIGCNAKQDEDTVIVKANIKNLPAKKVYLTDAYRWNVFLDSAEYRNDTFSFNYSSKKGFEPFPASICFKNSEGNIQQLKFKNKQTEGNKDANTAFVLEKGVTKLTGYINIIEHNATNAVYIDGGSQNKTFYETQKIDFGSIDKRSVLNKNISFKKFEDILKDHPDSYYLMQCFYYNREDYTEQQLRLIISLFKVNVQHSKFGSLLTSYVNNLGNSGSTLSPFFVSDVRNNRISIIDTTSKLNMLIFWASWCKPCRSEIPELKTVNKHFAGYGLEMRSISIDYRKDLWNTALQQEKMPWKQLIVEDSEINMIEAKYRFSSIPQIIFTDKNYNELKRFSGYDRSNEKILTSFIIHYLDIKD